MPGLKPHEELFLEAQLEVQKDLQNKIARIKEEVIEPLNDRYEAACAKMVELEKERKKIGAEKRRVNASSGLSELQQELSEVAKDVTKLLRKKRDAEAIEG